MSNEKTINISEGAGAIDFQPGEKKPPVITDQMLDQIVGNLLRIGVIVASVVVAIGAAVFFAKHGASHEHYHVFRSEPGPLRNVIGVVKDSLTFSGRGIMQLGLLLMIATPIMRVIFTLGSFIVLKDKAYIVITIIVLTVLLISLTGVRW